MGNRTRLWDTGDLANASRSGPQACKAASSVEERLMADEDLKAELERLRKENAALKKEPPATFG